ncbi:MAG TPA: HAD family phosphatase [Dehalococcoidia bacterium]|nr:HAD family phosphatase [Dehalococcoidia bacterium]
MIFDMDGVLVDTEPRHFAALDRVLAAEGHRLPHEFNHELLGLTLESTWDLVVARLGLTGPREDYYRRYDLAVLAELARPLDPLPGVTAWLDAVEAVGLPRALASSSPRAWVEATLAALGLADRFAVTVAGDEVTAGKPAPEIFLRTARKLGVPPSACLVIEDSPAGIEAGRRAGMRVLAVRTPLTAGLTLPADWVVDSLEDIDLAEWFPRLG